MDGLEFIAQLGEPVVSHEFDVDLGDRKLNASCSAFDVKTGYLSLTFAAMKGVDYCDLSHRLIRIKAVDSSNGKDVVVLKYKLTKLKAVLTRGDSKGCGRFGIPNVMTFEQRYAYTFVGIESATANG